MLYYVVYQPSSVFYSGYLGAGRREKQINSGWIYTGLWYYDTQ
jgi:hypothetical protein